MMTEKFLVYRISIGVAVYRIRRYMFWWKNKDVKSIPEHFCLLFDVSGAKNLVRYMV